ncbi:MAG: GDSL-type esterase/lipase family protein [Ruminococcus sp.]
MQTILFFGDSNTWGYDSISTRRYPEDVRFTGILSKRLKDARIIEEALKGRTNGLDDFLEEGRNGYKALPMVLCTHDPIDIFVIMLGTNDVKKKFRNSAIEIGRALERNIQVVQTPWIWGGVKAPKILVVCPPGVTTDYVGDVMEGSFDEESVRVSKELDEEYRRIAESYGCEYLNAMEYTGPGKTDGVHLDEEGHRKLADALEMKLNSMM